MDSSSLLTALVLLATGACNARPEPRDASNATPIAIRNTAALVMNDHAVTEVVDAPQALEVLGQSDRSQEDRALDDGRQSADLLTYLNVTPGMRVAELGSGGGYFTELLARSVGLSGVVFAVNPPSLARRAHIVEAWDARLRRPANAHVVRLDREFSAPLPSNARGLDLVYVELFYRDLPFVGVDRRLFLASAFNALRPGGQLVVIDRATPQKATPLDLHVMHEEESRNARYEIERAGFHFAGEGRFLRSSTAPDDWNRVANASPTPLETQDRFVLAFVK